MGFAVGRENWLDKNWLELVRTGQAKPDSAPNCLRSPRRGLGELRTENNLLHLIILKPQLSNRSTIRPINEHSRSACTKRNFVMAIPTILLDCILQ